MKNEVYYDAQLYSSNTLVLYSAQSFYFLLPDGTRLSAVGLKPEVYEEVDFRSGTCTDRGP